MTLSILMMMQDINHHSKLIVQGFVGSRNSWFTFKPACRADRPITFRLDDRIAMSLRHGHFNALLGLFHHFLSARENRVAGDYHAFTETRVRPLG